MKWIGQHIWDFISRFRSDVYLDSPTAGGSDPDKFLGIDSNNKIIYRTGTEVASDIGSTVLTQEQVEDYAGALVATGGTKTGISVTYQDGTGDMDFVVDDLHNVGVDGSANQLLTDDGDGTVTSEANLTFDGNNLSIVSATVAEPVLTLKATHTTINKSGELQFLKDAADTEDNERLGLITFYGEDEGNNNTKFAHIQGKIAESDDGSEGGKIEFAIASHDGGMAAGLTITDGDANDEVDVTIGNGTASVTTAAGDLTVTTALTATTRKFAKTSDTDGDYDGDVVYFGGTEGMGIGTIYHYKSDGTWEVANANAVATCDGLLGVALGGESDVNGVLLRGMVTLDHDPGAVGDVLFLSAASNGDATATAPSGSSDIVRIIGYCLDASDGQIWFDPDKTFVELT